MALAPHSNFLCVHETIKCQVGSKLHSHTRFSWGRAEYFGSIVIVKICSRRQIPTYLQKSPRIRCGLDSKRLQLSSRGKQNLSSSHSVNQNVPKGNTICKFPEDVALMVRKKWGQLAKTAIVTLFILSVASKADAVDALKTCTCLLKECSFREANQVADALAREVAKMDQVNSFLCMEVPPMFVSTKLDADKEGTLFVRLSKQPFATDGCRKVVSSSIPFVPETRKIA